MQKLLMPFDRQMMLCGYKNPKYKSYWGYDHYGCDISTHQGNASNDHTIYSSGEGIVVAKGLDNKLGYGVVILYNDCLNHKTGITKTLVAKYMHMSKIFVEVNQVVSFTTPIGIEGKEGTTDFHLHLEFDEDIRKAYYTWTPQVAGGTFWKKGTDSTVNPTLYLHQSQSRIIVEPTYNPEWLNVEDFYIPLADDSNFETLKEIARLKDILDRAKNILMEV